ncbi:MAG: hypothetical protein WBC53_00615 [Phycisphaerae bacterium]
MVGEPESRSATQRPRKKPHGLGMLIVFAIVLLAIAIWCATNLLGEAGREARKAGHTGYLWANGIGVVGSDLLAICCLVLAAVRANKGVGAPAGAGPAEGTSSEQQGGPPEAPLPQEAAPETGQDAPKGSRAE